MKKKKLKRIRNSLLLSWFFLFVIVAIIIASIVRLVILISQSTFDNHHQFVLEIKQPNEERILVFNPDAGTISDLLVKGYNNNIPITLLLDIPVDGTVMVSTTNQQQISALLSHLFLHCNMYQCKGLNSIDVLKLYLFAHSIQNDKITQAIVSVPLSSSDIQTLIPQFFTDNSIYQQALTIAISNASGESGMGNKLAKLLSNIGCNVISVTSGENETDTTTIISNENENTYTIMRIKKILQVKHITMQKPQISDIMIIIGKKHPEF